MKAETKRSVIPAQAGIQVFAPGFRVSLRSPGMTGRHEWSVWVEKILFLSSGAKQSLFSAELASSLEPVLSGA